MKDTQFYNKESSVYSEKRYPKVARSYTQFFFKERLRLVLNALETYTVGKSDLSLLEIGCADGVVVDAVVKDQGEHFSKIIGIDISPEMIHVAQKRQLGSSVSFDYRSAYVPHQHDVILEIGVINYASFQEELDFIKSQLKADGVALITLAGIGSLWDRRRTSDTGFNNFLSYSEYEAAIREKFNLVSIIPVGLTIPLIWRLPALALPVESLLEKVLRPLISGLFHEKIYILRPKA